MRWLCAFWLVLGACLGEAALAKPALGEQPIASARHHGAFSVTLPASATRMGLVASFEPKDRALTLAPVGGAAGGPTAGGAHVLELPELPTGGVRSELVPLAGGERALVLRFGAPKTYVVVLLGPALSGEPGAPAVSSLAEAVVLKGMLSAGAEGGASLSAQGGPDGQRLILSEEDGAKLCGQSRRADRWLDAKRGRFVRVALPLLGAEQRKKAARVAAKRPQTPTDDSLYLGALPSAFETGAVEAEPLVNARFAEAALPYEVVDLSSLSALGVDGLLVRVREAVPPDASWDLWLWTDKGVLEVDTSGVRDAPAFVVDLPAELTSGCLGLTVGARAPFVEVSGRLGVPIPDSASLTHALSDAEGDRTLRELALRRPSVLSELASGWASLAPSARTRAEVLGRLAEPGDAEPFWVRQWLDGGEGERARAEARLRSLSDGGRGALVRALDSARPKDELELARALASLSPPAALRPIARRLGQRSAARRLELRKVLAELDRDPEFVHEVERLLADPVVPRLQKVEVLRAVAPVAPHLAEGARRDALALLDSASFREAYVLVPVALELSPLVPAAEQLLVEWVSGKRLELAPRQRAALRTQALSLAREHERAWAKLSAEAVKLLQDPFPRVRVAAATYLELAKSSTARSALEQRLRHDDWPAVREASLGALAYLRAEPAAAAEVDAAMTRALAKDPTVSVRARAARELDELPRPETVSALRRSLSKDESAAVRAEAARSLGEICDYGSVSALTDAARGLTHGAHDEADVRLGLHAVTALARLNPKDLDERLAPLTAESVHGPLKARIESAIARDRGGCASSKKQ